MPMFNVTLAHDISHYGTISIDAPTWEDAIRTLRHEDWWEHCTSSGDSGWEERVVHVETEDGSIVAEDINYNCETIHYFPIVHRLTRILDTCDVPDDTAEALVTLIEELRTMVRDPIFKKEDA